MREWSASNDRAITRGLDLNTESSIRALGRGASLPTWLHRLLRKGKSAFLLLWPTRNRSYFHGYLFDRQGGDYLTEDLRFEIQRSSMPRSYRSRFYFDIYEAPERALVKQYVDPNAVVLEVGACIGVVACVTNQLLANPLHHVAVEANPELIGTLRKNRDANGCQFRIEQAVVGEAGEVSFNISPLMTASRLGDPVGRPVTVSSLSIGDIQRKYDLIFDTLIADIEGAELDLFVGHQEILGQFRTIIIEVHPTIIGASGAERVRSLLRTSGLALECELSGTEVWSRAS